jgi:DNA-binding transcriptional LysR family regulator
MCFQNLDLDTLRTLVVANDLGGYSQAADRLGRTPSAISLQMKRLQQDVGAPLFRKNGRGLALTDAGEMALSVGRRMLALNDDLIEAVRGAALEGRVRLGFSQDFADTVLPAVLGRFVKLYPHVVVEVRIEGNGALADAIEQGQIDVALVVGQEHRSSAHVVGQLEVGWIAGRGFAVTSDQPLPLLLLGPQCAFRKAAVSQLDAVGRQWRVAATSPSLAGLWASAVGGLGITVRSRLAIPGTLVWRRQLFGLPVLAPFPVTLLTQPHANSPSVERLRAIIGEEVAAALPASVRRSVRSVRSVRQVRRAADRRTRTG